MFDSGIFLLNMDAKPINKKKFERKNNNLIGKIKKLKRKNVNFSKCIVNFDIPSLMALFSIELYIGGLALHFKNNYWFKKSQKHGYWSLPTSTRGFNLLITIATLNSYHFHGGTVIGRVHIRA